MSTRSTPGKQTRHYSPCTQVLLCAAHTSVLPGLLLAQVSALAQETTSSSTNAAVPPLQESQAAQLRPPARSEISIPLSASLGQGNITVPFGFSLATVGGGAIVTMADAGPGEPDRSSFYYGVEFSHSFSKTWYVDASYAHGSSSGNFHITSPFDMPTDFEIEDDWYKLYVRYAFPQFGVTRLSPYLRVGVTYVSGELRNDGRNGPNSYTQRDHIDDIMGNIGFGLLYSLYTGDRARWGIQLEGDGFFGHRFQDTKETLNAGGTLFKGHSVSLENDLWGGVGRLTGRFQYALGSTGLFKLFADGGIETRYTIIRYEGLGNESELLWGPYGRVGLSYSF
jgi:hypothetical protein